MSEFPSQGGDAHADDTPAERRKQRTREQIVEAADAMFLAEGAAGLSMRRLAERVDYSPAAIYKYFSSKSELVQALRELFFERLLERLEAMAPQDTIDAAAVHACLRAYVECGLEHPHHYLLAFAQAEQSTEPPPLMSKTFEAANTLKAMISEAIEAGLFRRTDPRYAASAVWSALHGVTLLLVQKPEFPMGLPGNENLSRTAFIDHHIAMLVRGLLAPDHAGASTDPVVPEGQE